MLSGNKNGKLETKMGKSRARILKFDVDIVLGVKWSNGVLRDAKFWKLILSKMKMTISGRITIFVKFFTEGFKLALVSRYCM